MFKFAALGLLGFVSAWSYDDQDAWEADYPMCGLPFQSPVDIKKTKHKKNKYLPDLEFAGSSIANVTMYNAGKSLKILTNGSLTMMDSPYPEMQVLTYVDIHWKSEHKIRGKRFDAEMQFFFESRSNYTYTTSVYSVLVKEGSKNKELEPFLSNLTAVKYPYNMTNSSLVGFLNIKELMPNKWKKEYYFYSGSSTAPPCDESIYWMIARRHITMSKSQLKELKTLLDFDSVQMEDNYRARQHIGARQIFRSFKSDTEEEEEAQEIIDLFGDGGVVFGR